MSRAATRSAVRDEVAIDSDPAARDRYVLGHENGTPFHLSSWSRAVRHAFGHETPDLVARRRGRITGVLPLGLSRSILFGRRLVSAPFAVYGGPLADEPETARALLTEAARLAESSLVGSLELRGRERAPVSWPSKDLSVTFRGPIARTDEAILDAIPKETRRAIRAGLREGFAPDPGWHALDDFYRLFARSYRDHGTPVFPKRWIESLRDELGDGCVLFSLRDGAGGPIVAAVLALVFRDEVLPYYVGAARDCYCRKVNHVLYYELMRWARARGLTRFDFGRSKRGTGSYDFKRRWGLTETPIDHRFHLVTDLEVPDLSPLNPRYARRIALWRKLPLWLANRLGPRIVRGLP